MPFTLSHAAAVLPLQRLLRGRAMFALLVVGSFVPDLPYFLPDPLDNINAHRLPGLLLFGLPCGWALYALWRHVLLAPIAVLLPPAWGALLLTAESSPPPSHRFARGTLSLLLGALSHIVWDTCTHRRGLAVHVWPQLAQPLLRVGGHGLPPYFFFQHGSTLLGFFCLGLFVRSRLRAVRGDLPAPRPPLQPVERCVAIALLALATLLLAGWRFSVADAPPLSAYTVVCGLVSAAGVVAVAYAAAWHACYGRERAR